MDNCSFCTDPNIKNITVAENELALAFLTFTPIVPGHILVCPKRHIQYYEESTLEEREAMEELRYKLKKALKKVFECDGFNYAWNEEKIGGQSIPHVHLHIVPRKHGDVGVYQYEPREFLYRPGPRTVTTPNEELIEIVNLVKNSI